MGQGTSMRVAGIVGAALALVGAAAWAADPPGGATFAEAGLWPIRDGERMGLVDRTGKVVIRPDAERAFPFSGGRAVFVKDRKYGVIDRNGKVVIPAIYSYARGYDHGLAFVLDRGRSLDIDERGEAVWSTP